MRADPLAIIGMFMLGASAGAFVTYAKLRSLIGDCRKALDLTLKSPRTVAEPEWRLGIKALIVGRDAEMIGIFSTLLREKGIDPEKCSSHSEAIKQLSAGKVEVVILDFDRIPECADMLKGMPNPNRQALVIAVATSKKENELASNLGATFVVGRPLVPSGIRQLLRGAYGRILRDSQTYFRFAVELPVSIRRSSGDVVHCTTLNVSQTGIAVKAPSCFTVGENTEIELAIPDSNTLLNAEGKIIWDDKHGKAGIRFQCNDASVQARYFEWLHDRFFASRQSELADTDIQKQTAPHEALNTL